MPEGRDARPLGPDQVDLGAGALDPGDAAPERLGGFDPLEAQQPPEIDAGLERLWRDFDGNVLEHGSRISAQEREHAEARHPDRR